MFTQRKPTCDEDSDDLLNYLEEYSAPRRWERYLILQEAKCKHPPSDLTEGLREGCSSSASPARCRQSRWPTGITLPGVGLIRYYARGGITEPFSWWAAGQGGPRKTLVLR